MTLNASVGPGEDSEYVLSFQIGQQQSGFYSGRTDRQTDGQTHPVRY